MNIKKFLVIIFLSGFFISSVSYANEAQSEYNRLASKASESFTKAAKKGQAAVVSISTVKRVSGTLGSYSPFYDLFPDDFFREYEGMSPRPHNRTGLGSGVLVSSDGYILTNFHVVSKVDKVTVTLTDGREFEAKILGSDSQSDLALLKIDGKDLPEIKMGDSDVLEVGDWAIAVGNPFGLSGTVTVGIVSAKGRSDVVAGGYSNFIQTDAAINPGNSGGALLNIKGELIGINTAIYSQTGGYMGIGFAIPVNLAKKVVKDIKTKGHVVRGWIGVMIQPITPDMQRQFALPNQRGALIGDVIELSPAAEAGLMRGDVIIRFDGKDVKNYKSLRAKVAELIVGDKVELTVFRKGKEKSFDLKLTESPDHREKIDAMPTDYLGLKVQEITPSMMKEYGLKTTEGLVVTAVRPGSVSHKKQLSAGDILLEINDHYLDSVKTYRQVLSKSDVYLTLVKRGGYTQYVILKRQK